MRRRTGMLSLLRKAFGSQESVLLLALVLLIVYVGNENSQFLATRNVASLFAGNAYIAIAALGMTMVIVLGHIDISVGSLMVTLSMLSGALVVWDGYPSWLSLDAIIAVSWLLPLVAGASGAVIEGIDGQAMLPSTCAGGSLGVRPEHIRLAHGRGVPASVESVEYLGGDSLVACRVGRTPVAVRIAGSVALARGDATALEWSAGAQHYFGPDGVRHAPVGSMPGETMLA